MREKPLIPNLTRPVCKNSMRTVFNSLGVFIKLFKEES